MEGLVVFEYTFLGVTDFQVVCACCPSLLFEVDASSTIDHATRPSTAGMHGWLVSPADADKHDESNHATSGKSDV